MRLRYEQIDLRLRHAFTITRGSRDTVPVVIAAIEHDGITGVGEASPSQRYGENTGTVTAFLDRIDLSRFNDPFDLEPILREVNGLSHGDASAKAAVDIALHDWIGKKLRIPLWRIWGCAAEDAPVTSFTIGIDTPEKMLAKAREAAAYPVLKVKVGVPNDREYIALLHGASRQRLRVDANEGWRTREEALEAILRLEELGVEFVEQPMPADHLADTVWLRERVHIPLIADESVKTAADIPLISQAFDGVNIKLMKCGGLREALRMIHTARSLSMKVMLGCMIESSVAISAAAQLSPLVDYADLDGNLLIINDPYHGVEVKTGKLVLRNLPGIGVEKLS
ncbi:MAG TPA: dipeptide epimerase [Bacteroidota bacterium]|nr:dipeptide epimerase [Bacteroidota bacterium]